MDDDDWRWMPALDPFIPTVDVPEAPPELGRIYGPNGDLISIVYAERAPFGFTT